MIVEVTVRDSRVPLGYRNWEDKVFEVNEDSPMEWLWRANLAEKNRWLRRVTEKIKRVLDPVFYDVMVVTVDGQSTAYFPFTNKFDFSDYMSEECINSLPMRMW